MNKRIPKSQISEIYKEKDLISLKISIIEEDIYIYNIYIEPITYLIKDIPPTLSSLRRLLLENREGYIILEDFNLHYPL